MNTLKPEFSKPSVDLTSTDSPWASAARSEFDDLLIKPEFAARRYKFPSGTTWVRVVPALKNSIKPWMLGVHALNYKGGRHAHRRTVNNEDKSVFDEAYEWFKKHQDDSLFSKANREGVRLLTDPVSLIWMLVEESGKTVARLLVASGYDGSRGGAPGLGHQIWKLSKEVDEDGCPVIDPSDPERGAKICVERKQTPGTRYPSYSLRLGRVPAPIDEMFDKMEPEELAALVPLEKVVHIPTDDEEWKLLGKVIDQETIDEIRASSD